MSGDKDSPKLPPEWRPKKPMGEALRDRYKEVLNEPVPERLICKCSRQAGLRCAKGGRGAGELAQQ